MADPFRLFPDLEDGGGGESGPGGPDPTSELPALRLTTDEAGDPDLETSLELGFRVGEIPSEPDAPIPPTAPGNKADDAGDTGDPGQAKDASEDTGDTEAEGAEARDDRQDTEGAEAAGAEAAGAEAAGDEAEGGEAEGPVPEPVNQPEELNDPTLQLRTVPPTPPTSPGEVPPTPPTSRGEVPPTPPTSRGEMPPTPPTSPGEVPPTPPTSRGEEPPTLSELLAGARVAGPPPPPPAGPMDLFTTERSADTDPPASPIDLFSPRPGSDPGPTPDPDRDPLSLLAPSDPPRPDPAPELGADPGAGAGPSTESGWNEPPSTVTVAEDEAAMRDLLATAFTPSVDLSLPRPWSVTGAALSSARRQPLALALILLLPLLLALVWLAVRTPTYASAGRLIVDPITDADDLRALPLIHRFGEPTRTVQTAAAVIETREIAAVAAQAMGPSWPVDDVVEHVTIGVEGQTNVLRITGTASTEEEAVALANAYVEAVIQVRNEALRVVLEAELADLEERLNQIPASDTAVRVGIEELMSDYRLLRSDPTLSVAEQASAAEPYGQRSTPFTLASAGVMGVMLAAMAAVLLDRRRVHMVRSVAEVEAALRVPVIGEVPGRYGRFGRSRRAGLVSDPSFRLLRYKIRHDVGPEVPLIVASVGEPVDAAQVAANLGVDLAANGTPVLLANGDAQVSWSEVSGRLSSDSPLSEASIVNGRRLHSSAAHPDLSTLNAAERVPSDEEGPGPIPVAEMAELVTDLQSPTRPLIVTVPSPAVNEMASRLSHRGSLVLVVRLDEVTLKALAVVAELLRYGGASVAGAIVIDDAARGKL